MKKMRNLHKLIMCLLATSVVWLCCGCGKEEMGRYVEESVEIANSGTYVGMERDGMVIRLLDAYGADMISADGGRTFEDAQLSGQVPGYGIMNRQDPYVNVFSMAGMAEGTRLFQAASYGSVSWQLVRADNQRFILTPPKEEDVFYPDIYSYGGYFYSVNHMQNIYRTDPATGETVLLTEAPGTVYLSASEKLLYVLNMDSLKLFDLETGEPAGQDETLSDYLSSKGLEMGNDYSSNVILYPYGEEVYILTHDGLYRHTLYKKDMELILDSSLYDNIGNTDIGFIGMEILEEESGRTFLILYSDGSLKRYTFDPTLPKKQEVSLRIYSVYEDINMTRAVAAFRKAHPELLIQYDVASKSDYALTTGDILKNLSTEIAAGTGPDILLMEEIPYLSYADKGVLADLSFLLENMTENTFFTNVADGFAREDGLFAIPMTFVVPVITAGDPKWQEELEHAKSLSDLADMVEAAALVMPENSSVIDYFQEEHTLTTLSMVSMGAWMNEDKTLNKEAIREFLTQAKRIYDAQMSKAPEEMRNWYPDYPIEYLDPNQVTRRFGNGIERTLKNGLGYEYTLGERLVFFTEYMGENYAEVNGYVTYMEEELKLMPGQEYGTCLPVTVMAVTSNTKHWEESRMFLEFVLSEEFQETELFGFPVNKAAYYRKQLDPRPEFKRDQFYGERYFYVSKEVGAINLGGYHWPTEEEFAKLDALLESVTKVSFCDSQLYDTVIRLGQAALTGERSIEETVNMIDRELQLYLAE